MPCIYVWIDATFISYGKTSFPNVKFKETNFCVQERNGRTTDLTFEDCVFSPTPTSIRLYGFGIIEFQTQMEEGSRIMHVLVADTFRALSKEKETRTQSLECYAPLLQICLWKTFTYVIHFKNHSPFERILYNAIVELLDWIILGQRLFGDLFLAQQQSILLDTTMVTRHKGY